MGRTIDQATTVYTLCSSCGRGHREGPCPPNNDAGGGLAVGSQVGEYRVTGFIGAGGMGMVYAGVHPILQRPVAIKVMAGPESEGEEAAARFLQEARATVALRHRNIVDVFACGRLPGGRYYLVMELVEGRTVRSLINDRGVLPLALVRVIMQGLLCALDAAEHRGIVHRDIKPENIMVTGDLEGRLADIDVKVLDLGLAKYLVADGPSPVKSRMGFAKGTPAYMSPEQCRAMGDVDSRSDIYAAGVVMFEMLAGIPPFDAESAVEIMAQHIKAEPASLVETAGVPAALDVVVRRALAKGAEQRFQTAAGMLDELTEAFGTLGPEQSQPALPRRTSAQTPRASQPAPTEPNTDASIPPAVVAESPPPSRAPASRRALWLLGGGALMAAAALVVSHGLAGPGHARGWAMWRVPTPAATGTPIIPIPVPALPRLQVADSPAHLARIFAAIEREAARAGVPVATTAAITTPLRDLLAAQTSPEVCPVGIFYFVVESQVRGQDVGSAAAALLALQANRRLRDLTIDDRLPALDTNL